MRVVHTIDIQDIMCDLRHELEVEGITLGLQRVQYNDVGKIGYVFGMMEKIDNK